MGDVNSSAQPETLQDRPTHHLRHLHQTDWRGVAASSRSVPAQTRSSTLPFSPVSENVDERKNIFVSQKQRSHESFGTEETGHRRFSGSDKNPFENFGEAQGARGPTRTRRGTGRSSVRDDSNRRSPSNNDEEHQASSSQRESQTRRRGKDGGRRRSRDRSRDRSRRHERRRSRSRSRKRSRAKKRRSGSSSRSSRSQSQEHHRKHHHEERHSRRRDETCSTAAITDRVLAPQSSSGSVPITAPAVTATEVTEVSRSPSVPGERSTTRILPTAPNP
jgi:hypothetical protein